MRKRIILFLILIIICCFGIGILKKRDKFEVLESRLKNMSFNIKMSKIKKDIIIKKRGGSIEMGGYAAINYDYYIDLDKNKIYEVKNFSCIVDSKKSYESITRTKKLTVEEKNVILELTQMENDYISDKTEVKNSFSQFTQIYYNIMYKGKEITINELAASSLESIINKMK